MDGPQDFVAIQGVLRRRFKHKKEEQGSPGQYI